MQVFFHLRRRLGALALLAIVLNAVMPTIGLAQAAWQGKVIPFAEICTSEGRKSVAMVDGALVAADLAKVHKACDFCGSHAGSFALHDAHPRRVAADRCLWHAPRQFARVFDPSFAWAAQRSRAPPLLS